MPFVGLALWVFLFIVRGGMCEFNDFMGVYQAHYAQVDGLWKYFQAVTMAVVGWVIVNDKLLQSRLKLIAFLLGYLIFCVGNYSALRVGQGQLLMLEKVVNENSSSVKGFSELKALSVDEISIFYGGVVLAVVVGVSLLARLKKTLVE
ncbi:hypothetical protein [Craterilacuibacter sp. RT1T]|uniref:hypothetical protein n=1 Tax=Craterilacuibacter sp. RT1T TaxID=2942211 RepID=UPI0020BFC6EA|nr:hypothetical protein [Craterilacuibacter sp. RT1T]MCL6264758.1 hypothetical protein [Craterilacuibacter sp. RT1T]